MIFLQTAIYEYEQLQCYIQVVLYISCIWAIEAPAASRLVIHKQSDLTITWLAGCNIYCKTLQPQEYVSHWLLYLERLTWLFPQLFLQIWIGISHSTAKVV